MRRVLLGLMFVLALAVAAAAFAPASLVAGRLPAATGGKLHLAATSGTVWRGEGVLTDAAGTWRVPLGWRLDPMDLLQGVRRVTLQPVGDAATPRAVIALTDDGVDARDVTLALPAAALGALSGARVLPALGGIVTLTSPGMRFERGAATGTADMRWPGARVVAGNVVADLGTVRLAIKPQGNGLAGQLSSEGGNVNVDGTLSWMAPLLAVDATLAATPDAPEAVTRLLALVGTSDASGRVRISWRGNVR